MKEERLIEIKELNEHFTDESITELAAKFAYEDMVDESSERIEAGEHLIIEQGGYFEDDINCWFNDLYDDYYEEIYKVLGIMTLYEEYRERFVQHYQQVYSETYFEEDL